MAVPTSGGTTPQQQPAPSHDGHPTPQQQPAPDRSQARPEPRERAERDNTEGRAGSDARSGRPLSIDHSEDDAFTSGPKVDPAAPGATNNGDLGRRMMGGIGPGEDTRSQRAMKNEWPTRGYRPGSENMSDEELPQGLPVRAPRSDPLGADQGERRDEHGREQGHAPQRAAAGAQDKRQD